MSTMDGDFAAMMDCGSLVDGDEDQVLLASNGASPSRRPCQGMARSGGSSALCEQRNLLQRCLIRLQQASPEVTADNIYALQDASRSLLSACESALRVIECTSNDSVESGESASRVSNVAMHQSLPAAP